MFAPYDGVAHDSGQNSPYCDHLVSYERLVPDLAAMLSCYRYSSAAALALRGGLAAAMPRAGGGHMQQNKRGDTSKEQINGIPVPECFARFADQIRANSRFLALYSADIALSGRLQPLTPCDQQRYLNLSQLKIH